MGVTAAPLRALWKHVAPFHWAHHPICNPFAEHVYRVGEFRLCIGCFTAYPVAIALFGTILLLGLGSMIEPSQWFAVGFALVLVQLFSLSGLSVKRSHKIIVKACLGGGLALATVAIVELSWHPGWKIMAWVVLLWFAFALTSGRGSRMRSTCDRCPDQQFGRFCPGHQNVSLAQAKAIHNLAFGEDDNDVALVQIGKRF